MELAELINRLDLPQETRESLQEALAESENKAVGIFQRIADHAKNHLQLYAKKRAIQKARRIQWGAEIHFLLQHFLAEGKCLQTAKKLARKEFIKAHKSDENDVGQPGLTRPAIHRYLEEYKRQLN